MVNKVEEIDSLMLVMAAEAELEAKKIVKEELGADGMMGLVGFARMSFEEMHPNDRTEHRAITRTEAYELKYGVRDGSDLPETWLDGPALAGAA